MHRSWEGALLRPGQARRGQDSDAVGSLSENGQLPRACRLGAPQCRPLFFVHTASLSTGEAEGCGLGPTETWLSCTRSRMHVTHARPRTRATRGRASAKPVGSAQRCLCVLQKGLQLLPLRPEACNPCARARSTSQAHKGLRHLQAPSTKRESPDGVSVVPVL